MGSTAAEDLLFTHHPATARDFEPPSFHSSKLGGPGFGFEATTQIKFRDFPGSSLHCSPFDIGRIFMPEIRSACEAILIPQSGSSRPVFSALLQLVAFVVLSCAIACSAQSSAAGSNWDHLKALPVHTRLHVSADHMGHTCYLLSVDDTALVCGRYTFPRAEVKDVKLTRYGLSYGVGAAVGAGAGAGIGVAVVNGTASSAMTRARLQESDWSWEADRRTRRWPG